MSQGLAVTWNNPDIRIERLGVPVSSNHLKPSTDYVIKAQVWNGSTEAPAVNVLVKFSFLDFGVGTISTPVGDTLITLPAKGAPGLPAVAEMPWRTPEAPGHYCIQVALVWPDDANPLNNLGQENVDVKALNSPRATFTFALRNDAAVQRTFRLEADSYAIPQLPRCAETAEGTIAASSAVPRDYSRHLRRNHPLPQGWMVEFSPSASITLAPGRLQMVTAAITSAGEPVEMQAVNVNAFVEHRLVGGVTFYVHS